MLRPRHRMAAEYPAIPLGGLRPIRHEELDMIQGEAQGSILQFGNDAGRTNASIEVEAVAPLAGVAGACIFIDASSIISCPNTCLKRDSVTVVSRVAGAVDAPNEFVETGGRRLAYRSVGTGRPLVLCTRFRGNMDVWDPLFLDSLASNGFRAITFDYSGLGLSTGTRNYNPVSLAHDARDLIDALDLHEVVLAGWSLGGLAAQACLAMFPQRISHSVLIGTGPPGPLVKAAEQLFYDTARRPVNTFEDEVILFFEPASRSSREAAKRSHDRIAARGRERSEPVPIDFAVAFLGDRPQNPIFPADAVLAALKATSIPILHIGGDHDISFPVENWYALNQQLPTLQLLTYPRCGHAPQHEHPVAAAEHIATFVRSTDHPPSERRT